MRRSDGKGPRVEAQVIAGFAVMSSTLIVIPHGLILLTMQLIADLRT